MFDMSSTNTKKNSVDTEEQKDCFWGFRGYKDQVTIDSALVLQVKRHQRNRYMAYIDFQQVFLSFPSTGVTEGYWLLAN